MLFAHRRDGGNSIEAKSPIPARMVPIGNLWARPAQCQCGDRGSGTSGRFSACQRYPGSSASNVAFRSAKGRSTRRRDNSPCGGRASFRGAKGDVGGRASFRGAKGDFDGWASFRGAKGDVGYSFSGTAARMSRSTLSDSMPSAWASKFTRMRCRRAGRNTRRMSSKLTL